MPCVRDHTGNGFNKDFAGVVDSDSVFGRADFLERFGSGKRVGPFSELVFQLAAGVLEHAGFESAPGPEQKREIAQMTNIDFASPECFAGNSTERFGQVTGKAELLGNEVSRSTLKDQKRDFTIQKAFSHIHDCAVSSETSHDISTCLSRLFGDSGSVAGFVGDGNIKVDVGRTKAVVQQLNDREPPSGCRIDNDMDFFRAGSS